MTDITNTITADIAHHHAQALAKAGEAVAHAQQVGKLLQQVKDTLAHGQWLPWLAENVTFSPRQAQRYLQVAAGRPLPIRVTANTTRVSHSEADAPRNLPGDAGPAAFVPEVGNCYACLQPDGTLYAVEPSSKWPGFFFVTRLYQDGETYDCTRRPVHADFVTENLAYYGLTDPASAAWKVKPSVGVVEALGTFEEVAA